MNNNLNSYELSRRWFDFAFDNPEKVSPNHVAIYFFAIEHCNRLGWKTKFGFPTQMAMDALGIKKHQTYIRYFNDLVDWNFFDLIQKSQNQYSANIISLVSDMPKNGKALDKAIITHAANQTETNGQSNGQSNSSIDKQVNKEQINKGIPTFIEFRDYALQNKPLANIKDLKLKYDSWVANGWKDGNNKKIVNWKSKILNTLPFIKESIDTPVDQYAAHMRNLTRA